MTRKADYQQAAQAVRAFYRGAGRLPTEDEWQVAEPGRPSARTIRRRWGWAQLLAAAIGVEESQVPAFQNRGWQTEEILKALVDERRRLGAWPLATAWEISDLDHPARRTVVRRFGSWEAAIAAAKATRAPRRRRSA